MHLLITTPIFPPVIGGPATYVYELCNYLKKKHEITVISFGNNLDAIKGIKIIPLRINYILLGTFFRQFSLFRAIIRNIKRCHLVYAQGPYVVGLMSCIACAIYRKPLMIKFVGDLVWETAFGAGQTNKILDDFLVDSNKTLKDKIKIWIQRWVFQKARTIIVPSEYLKHVLNDFYQIDNQKIHVIYNGIRMSGGRMQEAGDKKSIIKNEKSKIKDGKLYNIITIGRLVNWKQIDKIIQAVAHVNRKLKVQLSIIGSGPELNYLKIQTKTVKMDKNVIFLGDLSHSATLRLLSKGDLFILYSLYEGLPHTVIEAMLAKVPVITSNIPGTVEIAIHNKTALLANKDSPHDLAEKITAMLTDTKLSNLLTKNAYKLVSDKFNYNTNMNILHELIESSIS